MSFLKNIQEIRTRARQQIENGAVTKDYKELYASSAALHYAVVAKLLTTHLLSTRGR